MSNTRTLLTKTHTFRRCYSPIKIMTCVLYGPLIIGATWTKHDLSVKWCSTPLTDTLASVMLVLLRKAPKFATATWKRSYRALLLQCGPLLREQRFHNIRCFPLVPLGRRHGREDCSCSKDSALSLHFVNMPWGGFLGPLSWTNRSRTRRLTFFGLWLLIPSAVGLLGFRGNDGEGGRETDRISTRNEWGPPLLEDASESHNGRRE